MSTRLQRIIWLSLLCVGIACTLVTLLFWTLSYYRTDALGVYSLRGGALQQTERVLRVGTTEGSLMIEYRYVSYNSANEIAYANALQKARKSDLYWEVLPKGHYNGRRASASLSLVGVSYGRDNFGPPQTSILILWLPFWLITGV